LPFQTLRIGVISTLLPGLKAVTIAKTLGVLNARLAPTGNVILHQKNVAHDREALAQAIEEFADGYDLLIIFGASAITDRRDIIPAAIEAAGGRVEHFGMPVDPGNLLLIGEKAHGAGLCRIIGAPGCARSPKENGFDLVLQRVLAGLRVSSQDIRGMGVGGLLKEIKARPFPRGFNGEVE
jgi:molybdenum cofactor cytidylyltransferase